MAAGGVTVQVLQQEEMDRRDRREQAITPSGVARPLSRGLEGVRLGLNRPILCESRQHDDDTGYHLVISYMYSRKSLHTGDTITDQHQVKPLRTRN